MLNKPVQKEKLETQGLPCGASWGRRLLALGLIDA